MPKNSLSSPSAAVPPLASVATLFKTAFDGHDLKPLRAQTIACLQDNPADPVALMNLGVIEQLLGDSSSGSQRQAEALKLHRVFRSSWPASPHALRILAFMAPGDIGTNTPIDFLLEGSDTVLYMLYVVPGEAVIEDLAMGDLAPGSLPDHDVAIATPCESDRNRPVLNEIERLTARWPRPVLNPPNEILRCSREHLFSSMQAVLGVTMPETVRIHRAALEEMSRASKRPADFLRGAQFPLIARPVDSHAGRGLVKLDAPSSIESYLSAQPEVEFFISPFIDYRSADGLFRKYRVIWVDDQPFPCHMAISNDWKVWYYNAGMAANAAKRDEEARFMATFETSFARRHAGALAAIAKQFVLEYFGIDCAELPDGRLLIFEGGNDLVVHDMDPPQLYPYKSAHMQKLFAAFHEMLKRKSARAAVAV